MKEFDLFGFQVEIDEATTKAWYEKASEWDCQCEDCRYFIELARKKKMPIPVLEILEQFGIAPEKATYVCEMITEEQKVLYQFSYRMSGNIVKERKDGAKHSGFWHLCDDTDYILLETICRFEEKEMLVSKIAAFVIDDMTIR